MSALIALAVLLAPSAFAAPKGPVAEHGRLQVKGNRIVGRDGKPVSVAGNSLFWSQWMPQFYNADLVAWLRRDWNAGVVRVAVGIGAGGYLEHPEAETARACTVVDAAIREGMYVLIDWHDHNAKAHEAQATAFFQTMARKYGKTRNVVYDLWNEPTQVTWKGDVKPYAERVIAAIRKIDRNNLVLVGSPHWSQDVDVAAADPIKDPNVAYTLHFYAGTHKRFLRDKADAALAKGVPLFVSEWGTCDASGNGGFDPASTAEWVAWMKRNDVSCCNWSVADKVETASIVKPNASPTGGWKESDLTESGTLVRDIVRGWGG